MKMKWFILALFAILQKCTGDGISENELEKLLDKEYNKKSTEMCTKLNIAHWNFETDINNKTKTDILLNTTLENAVFRKTYWTKYFKNLNPDLYKNETIKRMAKKLKVLGNSILEKNKLTELENSTNLMANIYSSAKICPYKNQECNLKTDGLNLEPEISAIMAQSSDYDELKYVWKAWRDASGAKMKELYHNYVILSNEAAVLNGFKDTGDLWRDDFEAPNLVQEVDDLWNQVEPLYLELFKYVGRKLKEKFGSKIEDDDGLLPAHIFGNMWAQDWVNLSPLVKPFPNASKVDVTQALKDQNFTILKMFQTADGFYRSMGLYPTDMSYDVSKGAMIEKPKDGRDVVCHASAWDFCDGKTFRIKMCTKVNFEDFVVIHHEMGHIEYFLQYAKQPKIFQDGANPGFHEAIGDTIALSVSTSKHLKKIGLSENIEETEESSLNSLMDMALQKISFLPFGLLIDKWRWDVFSGKVQPDQWNNHWWSYRKKYQKMKPPVPRSENDFDPGAKYHVPGDSQYISYFIAEILQFQFYKSLCVVAGEYDPVGKTVPLHKCDFYQSKEAGKKFSAGLALGSSRHWRDVLEVMTGEREMSASALLEYFDPLYQFLKKENSKNEKNV